MVDPKDTAVFFRYYQKNMAFLLKGAFFSQKHKAVV